MRCYAPCAKTLLSPKPLASARRCSLPAPSWPTRDNLRPAQHAACSRARRAPCVCAASTDTALPALPEVEPLRVAEGAVAGAPAAPGVYAVYDSAGVLQYIGLSRKVLLEYWCCTMQVACLASVLVRASVPLSS